MNIETVIIASAKLANVAPALLLSVCTVESNLQSRINVLDHGGASYGICQVKLTTAKGEDPQASPVRLLTDPAYNSFMAGKYLARQLRRYHGNQIKAVMAYNAGSWKGRRASKTNREYLKRVTCQLERYATSIID